MILSFVRRWYLCFVLISFSFSCWGCHLPPNPASPNIIVIFTDDQGYADLGVQGVVGDIRTPHIDQLALNGARFTNGYVTAPVCGPSRVGLVTGQYQQRFGVESNKNTRLAPAITTLPQRMKALGYTTGMVGKSHFGRPIATMGFDEYFEKKTAIWEPTYRATHNLEGVAYPAPQTLDLRKSGTYRIDAESRAATQFIERHASQPFFLYVAYTAPHVPLVAPQEYLARFSKIKDEKRRLCLAMMAAVDEGVGQIMASLRGCDIEENTLVFFISDNGAPLNPEMEYARDGSLNTPLNGEKGLLLEGGIRVPWIMYWKNTIPAGKVIEVPVITLDVAATALVLAGSGTIPELDGINLLPGIVSSHRFPPARKLFWYTRAQQAVRQGKWKLYRTTHKEFNLLIDLDKDIAEQRDLAAQYPAMVSRLGEELDKWQSQMEVSPAVDLHPVLESRIRKFCSGFSKKPK